MKIKEILTLVLAFVVIFLVVNTPLYDYIAFIIALIIIFSVIFVLIKKRGSRNVLSGSHDEVFFVTTGIILMVFLTDGLNSSIFFLMYFLLFGVVFIYRPIMVFLLLIGLIAVFINPVLQGDVFSNVIKISSLILLAPIAFFFGNEFERRKTLEEKIESTTADILEDADELLYSEPKENEKINDIIEKSEELREEIEEES